MMASCNNSTQAPRAPLAPRLNSGVFKGSAPIEPDIRPVAIAFGDGFSVEPLPVFENNRFTPNFPPIRSLPTPKKYSTSPADSLLAAPPPPPIPAPYSFLHTSGSIPGTDLKLRRVTMVKRKIWEEKPAAEVNESANPESASETNKPTVDYGVIFTKPRDPPAALSLVKNLQIVEGYNWDGSLRYAPSPSKAEDVIPKSSSTNFYSKQSLTYVEGQLAANFTVFGKLPVEIRLRIWNYALPSDRVIKFNNVDLMERGYKQQYYKDGSMRGEFYIQTSYPGMLGACKESRKVARNRYTLVFGPRLQLRPIWVDFSRDILYFQNTDTLDNFTGRPFDPDHEIDKLYGDHAKIQFIMVGGDVARITIRLLGMYNALKSIIFEEQFLVNSFHISKFKRRQVLARMDLVKPKKDGGAGKAGCDIKFIDIRLMKLILHNIAWRKGMLDM